MNIELYLMRACDLTIEEAVNSINECKYLMLNTRMSNSTILDEYSIPQDYEREALDYYPPERHMDDEQFLAYVMVTTKSTLLQAVDIIEVLKDSIKSADPRWDDIDDLIESHIVGLNSDHILDIMLYDDDNVDDDRVLAIVNLALNRLDPAEFVLRWHEYSQSISHTHNCKMCQHLFIEDGVYWCNHHQILLCDVSEAGFDSSCIENTECDSYSENHIS